MPPPKKYWRDTKVADVIVDDKDSPFKQKKLMKRSKRVRDSKFLGKEQVVYIRKPENDWPSEVSKDDLLELDLQELSESPNNNSKVEKLVKSNENPTEALGNIPSLTYNQKMTNWFVLNKTSEGQHIQTDKTEGKGDKVSKRHKDKIRERNHRLKLLSERRVNRLSPGTEQENFILQDEKNKNHTRTTVKYPGFETEGLGDAKEVKYTRLFDGVENVKGDFEKAKLNMGVTREPPTKEELRQQRWDVVIRKHLEEKIEAGQKGYVNVRERKIKFGVLPTPTQSGKQSENQMDVINALRKSIREMSLKMSIAPPLDVPQKPNEYTVPELKSLLELQSKGPLPKFTVGQLRKILHSLGFTRNVVNYDDLVDKLESVAMKKYGCSLHSKKLKSYLRKEADKLISYQEFSDLNKRASTEKIHQKIAKANETISAFLRNGPVQTADVVNRRPLLKLFPPTYMSANSTGIKQIDKPFIPPKTYRERKRIREADEFWKKYGKDEQSNANWNKFRMDLEWKHQTNLMKGPGFPVQIKEKYPLIFGTDNAAVSLSPNFTTADLIAALNRIIHHPIPLDQMISDYEKTVDEYRKKFPRLFRFEEGSSPSQPNGNTKNQKY